MERKEAYEQIKKLGLQEECKKLFGKNFTQCKTNELEDIINTKKAKIKAPAKVKAKEEVKEEVKAETKIEVDDNTINIKESKRPFDRLLNILKERHILLESDVKKILA